MLNDLLLVSRIWFDEIIFGNDMIISFKVRINFQNYYPLTDLIEFYIQPVFIIFFPPPGGCRDTRPTQRL